MNANSDNQTNDHAALATTLCSTHVKHIIMYAAVPQCIFGFLLFQVDKQPNPPMWLLVLLSYLYQALLFWWMGLYGAFCAVTALRSVHKSNVRAVFWFLLSTAALVYFYRTPLIRGPQAETIAAVIAIAQNTLVFYAALFLHEEPLDELLVYSHEEPFEVTLPANFLLMFRVGFYTGFIAYLTILVLRL